MRRRTAIAILALVLALSGCSETTKSGGPAPSITVSPGSSVDVQSSEFQAAWWTWATSPEEINPVTDPTGAQCAKGQPDGVWLVAGTFGGTAHRTCTIPAGVQIAGPLVNSVAGDEAECDEFIASAKGTVTVGGSPKVTKVEATRFQFVAAKGNPGGWPAGRNDGYGCGIYFTAGPFTPGRQQLVIRGSQGSFAVEATYNLIIKASAGTEG